MRFQKLTSVCCLLLAVLMTVSLWGCTDSSTPPANNPTGGGNSSIIDEWENEEEEEEEEQGGSAIQMAVITFANLKTAKVVYPANIYAEEGAVESAIDAMMSALNYRYSSFGISLEKTTDQILPNHSIYKEHEYEILVGDTNRKESSEAMTDLLQGDWGFKINGKKIVIKAGSEEKLVEAIKAFQSAVLSHGSTVNFYQSSMDKITRDNRVGKDLLINGTHISNFAVVYPEGSSDFEMELARRMADHIALISGHKVPFYSDKTAQGAHEILIGKTNRAFTVITTEGAAVEADQNHIAVVGSNAYDFGLAQEHLADLMDAAAIAKKELTLPGKTAVSSSLTVSMMSYNVYGFDYYDSRCDNIRRLVTKYLPDIFGYQEPDVTMTNKIRMEGYYDWFDGKPRHTKPDGSLVPNASSYGANSISPIFWAKDRYEFILGDTKWTTSTPDYPSKPAEASHYRMYTYAMLRDTLSGQEFIVVNWHMDFDEVVQVPGLQYMFKFFQENYTDLPVIMLGDFNATATSKVVSEITVKQGGFTSMHNMATNPEASSPAGIDWIFGMSCCVSASFYKVCRETYPDTRANDGKTYGDGKYPSDHCPVYAEFKFKHDMTEHEHDWSHIASEVQWANKPTVPERP